MISATLAVILLITGLFLLHHQKNQGQGGQIGKQACR